MILAFTKLKLVTIQSTSTSRQINFMVAFPMQSKLLAKKRFGSDQCITLCRQDHIPKIHSQTHHTVIPHIPLETIAETLESCFLLSFASLSFGGFQAWNPEVDIQGKIWAQGTMQIWHEIEVQGWVERWVKSGTSLNRWVERPRLVRLVWRIKEIT